MTNHSTSSSHSPLAIVILAAGMGTRMKSALPKVMHPLAGQPMLLHVVATALQMQPDRLVVVRGGDHHLVEELVQDFVPESLRSCVRFIEQRERLGTAHAVKEALPALAGFEGNVLILYGDTPLLRAETLQRLQAKLEESHASGPVVLGFRPKDPAEYGRLVVDAKQPEKLAQIIEYKDASEKERAITLCNSGVMGVSAALLQTLIPLVKNENKKQEYYLTDLVELANAQGQYSGFIEIADETEVLGINDRKQQAEAERVLQQRLREQAMANGVTLIDPETVYLGVDTIFGQDVVIFPHVVIGKGVSVGNQVEIRSFSHIEQATIADEAVIGPYARLRPGADIGKAARIGNFVEVKKSVIGDGAKVSHLSYIGDTTIGKDANIGAGTITCNYDGYMKYQTHIGEGCFVGSNTILVAPVTVGDGAITAAGSVITKSVAKDSLTVARAAQVDYEGKAVQFREQKKALKSKRPLK